MKKSFILLLIAIFVVPHVFAGGASGTSTDGKTVLSVFHYLDKADDISAGNFEVLRKEFARLNPDIVLDFDYLTNEPYHNKLQTLAVANELPDLVFLWPGKRTGQITGSGKIKDISSYVEPHRGDFFPASMTAQGPNGEIWELPEQVTATHVMFVNMRLLKSLGLSFPKTFNELLAQNKTIQDAGLIPIAMDNKDGWQMQSTLLSALVERTAGRAWLEQAIRGDAKFTDKEFVSALEVIKTLSDREMFSPGVNSAEYGRALTDFVNGKAVYLIDGGWRVANLKGELDESQYNDIAIRVFPKLPNEKGQANSSSVVAGTGFGMNASLDSKKADAAWKWIWFFSGPEGGKIKQEQGWLPAYKLPLPADSDVLTEKFSTFLAGTPGGYVIDAVLDGEGMSILHPGIQEMMLGKISAMEVARRYEEWVAANDSGRK